MIVVKMQGGLGNQMFQYAFGLSIAQKLKSRLYFDTTFFNQEHNLTPRKYELDIFNAKINIAGDKLIGKFISPGKLQRLKNKTGVGETTAYTESSLNYYADVFSVKPPAYFEGFWPSERYFAEYRQLVRNGFTFKALLSTESIHLANIIQQQQNAVSLHIRRGDYVSSASTNQIHGICSLSYYHAAIDCVKQQVENPVFYLFSDDAEWVAQNLLPGIPNATLIQHNQGDDSWQDMALMSKCRHHIIANSSFSWWGAWLNPYQNKMVIAPKNWFNATSEYFNAADIIPENWTTI